MRAFVPLEEMGDSLDEYPVRFVPVGYAFSGKAATTPLRPIFDNSAKFGEDDVSFNELTFKGVTGNRLSSVLTGIRAHIHSGMCDVSKAFWNLEIDKRSQSLRRIYLPIDKNNKIAFGKPASEVEYKVFII